MCIQSDLWLIPIAGFLQQFAGVCRPDEPEKNMATVVEQLSGGRTPTRVLCCGHSLGGALATLGKMECMIQLAGSVKNQKPSFTCQHTTHQFLLIWYSVDAQLSCMPPHDAAAVRVELQC